MKNSRIVWSILLILSSFMLYYKVDFILFLVVYAIYSFIGFVVFWLSKIDILDYYDNYKYIDGAFTKMFKEHPYIFLSLIVIILLLIRWISILVMKLIENITKFNDIIDKVKIKDILKKEKGKTFREFKESLEK
jgi:hypothetical protein